MAVPAFVPAASPRIAVARDGSHAVLVDPQARRGAVIRISDHESIVELPLPTDDAEVAWLGASPRLLVVAPVESHTEVRLVNPFAADDARRVAEIRLETGMRLGAANGAHALLLGTRTAAVLSGGDSTVTPYQFLARTLPSVVGVAGTQFVVALPGTIEEWDPASRMPKRRLRLPRVATITSLGGSDRVLWMTTHADPTRLEVLPLVNRGQPKGHDLPEPIRSVHGHPHTDAVICIGAETGRIYAVDLDGRARLRTIAVPGIDRAEAAALIAGAGGLSVIAAQAGRPIGTAAIDQRDEPAAPPAPLPPIQKSSPVSVQAALRPRPQELHHPSPSRSSLYEHASSLDDRGPSLDDSSVDHRASSLDESPPDTSASVAGARSRFDVRGQLSARGIGRPVEPAPIEPPSPTPEPSEPPTPKHVPPTAWSEGASELMAKLAALKTAASDASPDAPQRASWRDDAGAWARAVASGTFDRAAPSCPPIDALAERVGLPDALVPALVLLYGSHLAGLQGAAPMDVARVLGRRWDDALGKGKLAELGLAHYQDSRVRLAPSIQRELDDA